MRRRNFLKAFVAAAVGAAVAPALAEIAPGIAAPQFVDGWRLRMSSSPQFAYGFTGFKPYVPPDWDNRLGQVLCSANLVVVDRDFDRKLREFMQ